ncbi:MAG TPA: helix-turn-helix domain-containing protein [Propionibacteriaceae bacterium]
MTVFGEELRRLRRRAGLSQETLAGRAGLSSEAVSLLERGRRTPRMTTMRLLAEALDLPERDRVSLFSTVAFAEPAAPVLPIFPDAPVGRADDLQALAELMAQPDTRLVTLVGPSGVGKTRLAVAYANSVSHRFPDGVHWLPTGSLPDARATLPALAGALGVRTSPATAMADIVEHLRPQRTLLIIDNAEHQLEAVARLASRVLASAPWLKILLTSRHLLRTPGERPFHVVPLELPPPNSSLADVRAAPASQLFLSRAALGGVLTQFDADAVVRICHRLDGLPLALELAAARTNVLTVAELADTLDSELGILLTSSSDGERELVDAMVSWSYHLLSSREQLLFDRLSVFSASFTREAAAAVCAEGLTEVDVLDVLSSLVSKSLVTRRDDGSPQARFRLLQLIQQYAHERFEERVDSAATHRRHAEYFCGLTEQAAPHLDSRDQQEWLAVLDRDPANIRAAVDWAVVHEPTLALRMVAALSRWCYLRGRYTDGRNWAAAALQAAPSAAPELRASALASEGLLAFLQCDYEPARAQITEALSIYSDIGDLVRVAWATARLGGISRELGDYAAAEAAHLEAMAMASASGDDHGVAAQVNYLSFLAWLRGDFEPADELGHEALVLTRQAGDAEGVIWALINLGTTARYRGDLVAAELMLSQCLDQCEDLAFREGMAWALNQLGAVARRQGHFDRARGLQLASLAEHRELGDRWRAASVHDELAAVALDLGQVSEAARELGAADRLREEISAPIPTAEVADRLATVAAVKQALGSAYAAVTMTPV